jgi:hypothetical protein
MVYLVDRDDDAEAEEMQDKNKISLFDDSKFDEATIEHRLHDCD